MGYAESFHGGQRAEVVERSDLAEGMGIGELVQQHLGEIEADKFKFAEKVLHSVLKKDEDMLYALLLQS